MSPLQTGDRDHSESFHLSRGRDLGIVGCFEVKMVEAAGKPRVFEGSGAPVAVQKIL